MAKRGLTCNGRVTDVVAPGDEFPVHPDMKWIDCPDTVRPGWIHNPADDSVAPDPAREPKTMAEEESDFVAAQDVIMDRVDYRADLEFQVFVFRALRDLIPDLDTKPYMPAHLVGVTDRPAFRQAMLQRRRQIWRQVNGV